MTRSAPLLPGSGATALGKLKWLMSIRLLFGLLLLGSSAAYQLGNQAEAGRMPLVFLYGLSVALIALSGLHALALRLAGRPRPALVYLQIACDSLCITAIIFITGGYASVFSFLYLLVIIYASVFVFKRGTLLIATVCCLQFAGLLFLELHGTIHPYGYVNPVNASAITALQVLQKCAIMAAGCFSVAFLSGYLSDQERQSKAELAALEVHLGRVQSLAQIGEMAAGLAHEIKNPLASLSGAIQILSAEMENSRDNMRLMHIVLRETHRLGDLVNNFLTFARPSPGKAQRVRLGEALAEVVALFGKDRAFSQRIQVELEVLADAEIEIDPVHLRQVVWNLLLNGAESIAGQGTVRISVQRERSDQVKVEIADEGCGMDEGTVAAIFNPFYTTKSSGTGLGLSIVHRILTTYDCRLDVWSQPGRGSVFTMHFKTMGPA